MAKTSFRAPTEDPSTESSDTQHAEASSSSPSSIVASPNQSPATYTAQDGVEGEFNRSDIKLPRLNLVNVVGPLSEDFTPGNFIFDREITLSDGKVPIILYVLGLVKEYQEDTKYSDDVQARIFKTDKQVRAAGGTTEWDEKGPDTPYFKPKADMMVLIEAPAILTEEQIETHFNFEADGKRYALGVYTVNGGAYKTTAREVISARLTSLKSSLFAHGFKLTSSRKKGAKGSWMAPAFSKAPASTTALRELIAEILNPKQESAE